MDPLLRIEAKRALLCVLAIGGAVLLGSLGLVFMLEVLYGIRLVL